MTNSGKKPTRKELGLCSSCGSPALPGKSRCQKHEEKASEDAKHRYDTSLTLGLCPLCKDPSAEVVAGKTCCRSCLDKQAAATAARRPGRRTADKVLKQGYYQKRVAAGVCVLCGKRPATSGRTDCDECNAARKQKQKDRYAAKKPAKETTP